MDDEFRYSHLYSFISSSLNALAFDPINRQMEQHMVSAFFSPNRLIEIFESILNKEREDLIQELSTTARSLQKDKKLKWRQIKSLMEINEVQITENSEIRIDLMKKVSALQGKIETNEWKSTRLQQGAEEKIVSIQKQINSYIPTLLEIRKESYEIIEALEKIKAQVEDSFKVIKNEIKSAHKNALHRAQKVLGHDKTNNKSNQLTNMKTILNEQKKQTNQIRQPISDVIDHINSMNPASNKQQKVSEIPYNKYQYNEMLEMAVKKSEKAPRSSNNEPTQFVSAAVKAKVDNKIHIVEKKYSKLIKGQNKKMVLLQQELQKAQMTLQRLLDADTSIDPRLIANIDRSYLEMQGTQNKTDEIMSMLMSRMSSSPVSSKSTNDSLTCSEIMFED